MTSQVQELNSVHPLDCLVVAQVRNVWMGHNWFYSKGYIRYYAARSWMPCEHQLVADTVYDVPKGFHVHHIDENPLNNRADNLAVLSPSEHHRLHASKIRSQRIIKICPICNQPFEVTPARAKRRSIMYCGVDCRCRADRRVDRPSHDYLAELIATVNNFCELGRRFGVSDNAIRKWARSYGLL